MSFTIYVELLLSDLLSKKQKTFIYILTQIEQVILLTIVQLLAIFYTSA